MLLKLLKCYLKKYFSTKTENTSTKSSGLLAMVTDNLGKNNEPEKNGFFELYNFKIFIFFEKKIFGKKNFESKLKMSVRVSSLK